MSREPADARELEKQDEDAGNEEIDAVAHGDDFRVPSERLARILTARHRLGTTSESLNGPPLFRDLGVDRDCSPAHRNETTRRQEKIDRHCRRQERGDYTRSKSTEPRGDHH